MYQTSEADKSQSHTRDLAKASNTELVDALKDKNFFWRRTAQRLLVEREAKEASVLTALVALVDNQQTDEIGLNTAAMHAIWTLAGLAESGDKSAEQALASACGKGFQHPSSPVRNAAIGYCQADQVKQALELNLRTDADPRVRLTLLLRIADNAAAKPVAGQLISGFLLGQASTTDDDILLDAWTAAAATNPVETLLAIVNSETAPTDARMTNRISVVAEHIARSNPTVDKVVALLDMNPSSKLAEAAWTGLARGWPKNLTLALSEEAQKKFRDRYLAESTSIECKAAILSVADKWSIRDLDKSVAEIQSRLFTSALDTALAEEKRLSAWEQAIRLAPPARAYWKSWTSSLRLNSHPRSAAKLWMRCKRLAQRDWANAC